MGKLNQVGTSVNQMSASTILQRGALWRGLSWVCLALATETVQPAPPWPLGDKTLVAWVSPANLSQRGGSVLTLEEQGGVFDAIVFGEITPGKWMAGSDGFKRTLRQQGDVPAETADSNTLVQIAVTYRGRQIRVFRNGALYSEHTAEGAVRFGEDCRVLIGLRHFGAAPENRFFVGSIEDARIYPSALDENLDLDGDRG